MVPENVFVDTSAWMALADKDDTHHKKAASIFPSLLKAAKSLVTSNLIVAESYILMRNELGHQAASNFLRGLKTSPRILKVYSNEDIEIVAEGILARYGDQDFSYTDAVSFAIMERLKIRTAFCFDKHFVVAGFTTIP